MNIELHLSKSSLDSSPEVTVRFGEVAETISIRSGKQQINLRDLTHDRDQQLIVERDEQELYHTGLSHHENKIIVDKVIVDDFWEFNKNFYTPKSVLSKNYKQYINRFNNAEWIKQNLSKNTHIFFNGTLTWDVKYPVRRTFFKDTKK